jgi:hypothetical protein
MTSTPATAFNDSRAPFALAVEHFDHQLARFASRLDEILACEGEALAVRIIGVEGHDRNAGLQDAIDDRRQCVTRHRGDRKTIHLAHQRLDLADLRVRVGARRPDELGVDLVIGGGLLHPSLHERREFVRDVMVRYIEIERLARIDLRLDAVRQREIAELLRRLRRQWGDDDRDRENGWFQIHCFLLPL